MAPVTPVSMTVAAGDGVQAAAAARMVRSFIDFTRWPARTGAVTICVVGPTAWSSQFDGMLLGDGRRTVRKAVTASGIAAAGCNVVYAGRIDQRTAQQVFAAIRGKGVLTIAENAPQCRSQAMFCLRPGPQSLSFSINIDAVSRSGLRIDPRVLRMASGGGG